MVIQPSCILHAEVNFMHVEYLQSTIYVFVRENCVKIRVLASIPSLFERRMTFGGICSIFGNNIFLQSQEKFITEENE